MLRIATWVGCCIIAAFVALAWVSPTSASIVANHKCLQATFCQIQYGTCENASYPSCNEPCDNECSPITGLICLYKEGSTCNSTGSFTCPGGLRKTCNKNAGGVEQCDCYLPYISGRFACGSVVNCSP